MNEPSRDQVLTSIIRKIANRELMDEREFELYKRVLAGG